MSEDLSRYAAAHPNLTPSVVRGTFSACQAKSASSLFEAHAHIFGDAGHAGCEWCQGYFERQSEAVSHSVNGPIYT